MRVSRVALGHGCSGVSSESWISALGQRYHGESEALPFRYREVRNSGGTMSSGSAWSHKINPSQRASNGFTVVGGVAGSLFTKAKPGEEAFGLLALEELVSSGLEFGPEFGGLGFSGFFNRFELRL